MVRRTIAVVLLTWATALPVASPAHAAGSTVVDVFEDSYDGSCSDGDCSLRDAVASTADGGVILLPSGFYTLTIQESGGPGDGQIDLSRDVAIRGQGETGAFVDASSLAGPMLVVDGGAEVVIADVTVFGSRTPGLAAPVWVRRGRLTIKHVTMTQGLGRKAGAILTEPGGKLYIVRSLLLENRGRHGAGAIDARDRLVVLDSTLAGNHGYVGGAVRAVTDRAVELRGVTISGNTSQTLGGGIALRSPARLHAVTVAGNRATTGGGIARIQYADVRVGHTIVAGNRADAGTNCTRPLVSLGGNVEAGTGCGFSAADDLQRTDPKLGALTSNGGPTPTRLLAAGSPAIDVGGRCDPHDQRGAPRDGPCDAGAYERVLCGGRAVDIVGTRGDDDLSGGREPDTFLGLGGDDLFQGSLADDIACGGRGDDVLWGGPGPDILRGGDGRDLLDGEDGVDRCFGGPGRDRFRSCEAQRTSRRRPGGQ